jgi:3-oxoacyl-[acyl-carrier protein] reductase
VFGFHQDQRAAAEVIAEVKAMGGRAEAVQVDVGRMDDVRRLVKATGPQLDILVNNAATNLMGSIQDVTEADYDRVMAVNAKGPFFTMQCAIPRLRDNGRIINISTVNTVLPVPNLALYAASKAALEQFTAVAARELGERGITVNTISPGATDTELLHATNPPEALDQAVAFTALRRLGRPTDIASVVSFLAGPDSQWITGQNLRVSGGFAV